jgi:hypothetical protein
MTGRLRSGVALLVGIVACTRSAGPPVAENPRPRITSLSPSTAPTGAAVVLTVHGAGFDRSSRVLWNGEIADTTFVSSIELSAAITGADTSSAGEVAVTVATPPPGGGSSGAALFTILDPAPAVSALSPSAVAAGGSGFSVTVDGSGFVASTVILWNGTAIPTSFVSASRISGAVPASFLAFPGTASVVTVNPGPGGGTSAPSALSITGVVPADVRFVAPTGSDASPGTVSQPWLTIQRCASTATTCAVRAGTYRERVVAQSGVTITAYDGEVVTVDGTDPVTGWSVHQGPIFEAPVTLGLDDSNQVFVDGEMMTEARWPNGDDLFAPVFAIAGAGTQDGQLVDPTLPPADWTGARLWLWSGDDPWDPQTGIVTSSAPGRLAYAADGASFPPFIRAVPGGYYYLAGSLAALDAPREWAYAGGTLYLWAPGSADPATRDVRAKRRETCFDLSGRSNVTLRDLGLFACNVTTDASSTNVTLDRLNVRYVSHFTRLKDWNGYPASYWYYRLADSGIVLDGSGNTLQNSVIAFSAGNGVTLNGAGHVVRNNLIHHVDYAANNCSAVVIQGTGHQIQHNSLHTSARFNLLATSVYNYPVVPTSHVDISYNDVHDAMLFSRDGGQFYVSSPPSVVGSRIHHNWFHGAHALYPGPADDFTLAGVYLDEDAPGWEVDQNVLWNNQFMNVMIHGSTSGATDPNDNAVHDNTIPDAAPTGRVLLLDVAFCGSTSVADNLVLVPVQQWGSSCSVANNGRSAPGATEMMSGVRVGCDLAGCGSGPPPAISDGLVGASIVSAPRSQRVPAGGPATFAVIAAGSPPLSYQWRRNGAVIQGATSPVYVLPAAARADDGSTYAVRVSNTVGTASSTPATLRVE